MSISRVLDRLLTILSLRPGRDRCSGPLPKGPAAFTVTALFEPADM